MKIHEKYIKRCVEIAKNALGTTSPNPMVGCVIVHQGKIIGEGYTSPYGGNHAEVNAIQTVKETSLLIDATLYVSLEPCSHYGKTPPCSDKIIESGIKNVVIGCIDPNEKVAGQGIQKLKDHGINVTVGVLNNECVESNKRFMTFHTKQRPYIILKWAESSNGFIDVNRKVTSKDEAEPTWISNIYSRQLVHKWRADEDAILVGTNTVVKDNPGLNTRNWSGKDPVRIILDRNLRIPKTYHIYNQEVKTIILTEQDKSASNKLFFEKIDFSKNLVKQICDVLYKHQLLSVMVEGGRQTLQMFIDANLWDEVRVFIGTTTITQGISAPSLKEKVAFEERIHEDTLKIIINDK